MALLNLRPLRIGWPPVLIRSAQGGPDPEPDPAGPLRIPTPRLTRGIVLGGHSSLQPLNYDGILAAAVGPVMTAGDRQSSQDVWNGYGPSRTADYDLLILSETDGDNYQGLADPATAQGRTNLQHLYWLGLEAKDRGAELALFNSPAARSNPVDESNRQRMNYYRQWLEAHLDMSVWIVPGELYVQELRDRELTDAEIFRDNVHLADGAVSRGAAYQAVAFVTGELPTGIPSGDQLYAEAALASVQRHWWSGLGGAEFEQGMTIADPLPDPLPRSGEPEPVDGILWTAQGYQGPELTGNQPVIADGVMTFDGTGLHGPFVSRGFYACMSIRSGDLAGAGVLLFVNPDPANVYADPFHALKLSEGHGNYMVERWPDPGEVAFRSYDGAGWTVVEGWVSGTLVGGFDGAEDAGGVADSDAPETPSIMILSYGRPIEVAYLRVAKTMPTTEQRSAYRSEAQATIPQEAL